MSYPNRTTILTSLLLFAPLTSAQELAVPDLPSRGRSAIVATPAQDAVWRSYDISDLTGQARANGRRRNLGLVQPTEAKEALDISLGAQKSATKTAQAIALVIKVHGLPAFEGNGAVRADVAGNLLVSGTPAQDKNLDYVMILQLEELDPLPRKTGEPSTERQR